MFQDELVKIRAFREPYMTAKQAAGLAKKGCHAPPNLETRGEITSTRTGDRRKIRFFDRGAAKRVLLRTMFVS